MFMNKSIIWKLALPVPIAFLVCLAIAWFMIPEIVMGNARDTATDSALQTANQFKVIRSYYTKNVIQKAKANGSLKPAVDHAGVANAIPLPATMILDLSKLLAKNDTTMALYSAFPFPGRKDRVLDDFQKSAWAFLNENPDKVFKREETRNGATSMRVAIADKMVAQGCVDCHNSHPDTPRNDWELGDVRGILEIDSNIGGALAAATDLKNKIILGMVLVGLVIFIIVFFSARSTSIPVRRITEAMNSMASGDLAADIPKCKRSDEIGQMSRALGVFQDKLMEAKDKERLLMDKLTNEFASTVGTIVESVTAASAQLDSTALSMSNIADETSSRSAAVSAASEQASTNVQTVAAASEEMSRSIAEINQQVGMASSSSKQAVSEVKKTGTQMDELAATADKIGDVIKMISEIAEQTNLLALNATIEAARAGESGKGFAVVANEVKNLAGQTGKATEEIIRQVEEIQSATKQAVVSMANIGKVIKQVDESSTAIAASIEEQGTVTQEISHNVQEAASGTKEVTRNITAVHQASQETGATSNQVKAAASELSQQAGLMKSEVDKFIAQVRMG
jgi:methyl-accepting chemotaxis protein